MQYPERRSAFPAHGDIFKHRMDILKRAHYRQRRAFLLALIEHVHIEKREIFQLDLRMILP